GFYAERIVAGFFRAEGTALVDDERPHLRLRPVVRNGPLENSTAIGALALEHRARIMQAVGEHVQRGLAPGDELAVVPDDPLEAVVRLFCHGASPRGRSGPRAPAPPPPYALASRAAPPTPPPPPPPPPPP